MDDFETKMRSIAQALIDQNQTSDQFAVSQTPYHTHNGTDSPRVSFKDLVNRQEFININLMGAQGQTTNNWGVIFTAPFQCAIIAATEVHQIAESTATTMTVQVEKLTGIQASGAGISLLLSPFNLKATANTVQTPKLNTISVNTTLQAFNLKTGDRLGLVLATTGSASATLIGVNIVITLQF